MSSYTRAYAQGYDPWWIKDDDAVYASINTLLQAQDNDRFELQRQRRYRRYAAMYDNTRDLSDITETVRFNMTQAIIDTAAAQVAGQRTLVMALTKMGDDAMQRRAKKTNMFLEGLFSQMRQSFVAAKVFLNGAIFGIGCERPYTHDGRICVRNVHPRDFFVPSCESLDQEAQQIVEVEPMSQQRAIALWPEHEDAIAACQPIRQIDKDSSLYQGDTAVAGRTVFVHRAWRLPAQDDPSDDDKGRYVACLSNVTLESSEYTDRHFPHCFFRWSDDPDSFYGLGACARLDPIQAELDELSAKIQRNMRLATTFMLVKKGAGSDKQKLSNQDMAVYEYAVAPPQVVTNAPIDAAYFAERDKLYQRGFDVTGISPMAAQGMKPAGINSGVALRLYKDVTSQRQALIGNNFDQLHVDVGNMAITLAKKLDAEGEGSFKIMARTGRTLVDLKWSDVSLPEDSFQIDTFPVSFFSSTPSAKFDEVKEYGAAFPASAPFLQKAINFPDTEAFASLANAPFDEIMFCLDSIVEDGVYRGPESQTDLTQAGPLALAMLRRGRANGLSDERCSMLRDYILACDQQQATRDAAAQAQAAAAAPPPGSGSMSPPAAAPVGMGNPPPGPGALPGMQGP